MLPAQEDTLLLERLKRDDELAFAAVYEKYRESLKFQAFNILNCHAEAHDLVQDFFMDFWEKRLYEKIEVEKSSSKEAVIKNYIFSAIHNRCINALNRSKTKPVSTQQGPLKEYTPGMIWAESQLETKELALQEDQTLHRLRAAIEDMPPQTVKIFSLAYGEESKSLQEIAEELHISYQTVKNVLSRRYAKLRVYLNGTKPVKMCINGKHPRQVNKLSREKI